LALLKPGDEVLLPDNAYGPSKDLARTLLADLGMMHRIYDPLRAASLPALIGPATKLLWIEAPGSVTMEFPDLVGLVRAGRQAGLAIALDNTWGAGLAFQPFALRDPQGGQWGVDLCMHALTKYPSGGGDVLMGSITSVDRAFHDRVLTAHMRLGLGVGANDAEAILRSLPSIELRYEAQDHAARELARWLQAQDAVAQVLHPALAGSPGHEYWAQQCTRAAGIFSILLHESYAPEAVDAFVDALRVFRLGYSWGGPVSLAVPYPLEAMRQDRSHLRGHLVRLCIGLEAVSDLKQDLAQALTVLEQWGTA
ncbi:MAG: cystathionine beta-lyase, partial [Betaproteobacteria bacterium]|nr:cystathionine beta-lyase [Betaproteobacteria bacterium]